MWGFYCIPFIEYILAGKTLLDYTNLFSLNEYKKNAKRYRSILEINMTKEESLQFTLRKKKGK